MLFDELVSCADVIGDGVFLGGVFHGKDVGDPVSVEPYNYVSRECDLVFDVEKYRIENGYLSSFATCGFSSGDLDCKIRQFNIPC